MKPKNFPARKLKRQQIAERRYDQDAIDEARLIRSKKYRGKEMRSGGRDA